MVRRVFLSILLVGWSSLLSAQTLVPKEAVFKGKLVARNARVDGVFQGTISTDMTTEVSTDGIVAGTIETTDLTVEGTVNGTILAIGEVILKPTAAVAGTLQCRDLTVEKGAILSALTSMGEVKTIGKKEEVKKPVTPTPTRRERRRERRRR